MTIYGTQVFWPLNTPPLGLGSIFIIDPLYSLPFLFCLIWFLINKSHKAIYSGLIISSLYLLWTVGAQSHVKNIALNNLAGQPEKVLVQPTPFNTALWRILVMEESGYRVGYYSFFDEEKNITFQFYNGNKSLLSSIKDEKNVQRLLWFTKGFYNVQQIQNDIVLTDLRMGLEPDNYIFSFKVAENKDGEIFATASEQVRNPRNISQLKNVWARIWDENVRF